MITNPVPPQVLVLIERIIDQLPEAERRVLLAQARSATVTDEVPGRMLDFAVQADGGPSSLPDGPLRPIPAVVGVDGQLIGELILWLRAGYLICLEQPWFGDEPPTSWPEVTRLNFS